MTNQAASGSRIYPLRFLLMASVVGLLVLGMWTGLERMGVSSERTFTGKMAVHGPLMVSGVLGTLISLERAIAFSLARRSSWAQAAYLAPLLSGAGSILLVIDVRSQFAMFLMMLGSFALIAIFIMIVRMHRVMYTQVLAMGTVCWGVGCALWLSGQPMYQVVHWWAAFLVLTIVGERLELSRVRRISKRGQQLFVLVVVVYLSGIVLTVVDLNIGTRLAGAGSIMVALWLLVYDLARSTIKQQGLPRFIAACLLSGYVWAGVSGGIALAYGGQYAGFSYDAMLHALFLGFGFSMIFGHAPIIIPSVVGRTITYRPVMYLPLLALQISLILRIVSDIAISQTGRQWGGLFNVVAILLFMGITGYSLFKSQSMTSASAT